jgi:hypothetical protein
VSLLLLALLAAILASGAGFAFLAVRSLELFRSTRGFAGSLAIELEVLANSLDRLNSFEPPDTGRVATAFARVESSKQRLEILTGALRRVQQQSASVFDVYPRK